MWTDELITIELETTEQGLVCVPIGSCCDTVFLLVGLAMWTDELITIELETTEQGLVCVPIGSCCVNCIPIGRPGHVDG
jgi:hypothetical protein